MAAWRSDRPRRVISLGVVFVILGLVSLSATGVAQEPVDLRGSSPSAAGASIPLEAVDLFSSGVGTFTHGGVVEGDAEVRLTFTTDDVNDILKSLVVQDADGGRVAISYPSQDPIGRILDSFSLDIGDNPSLAQLLTRARGERVVLGENVEGTISGLEYRNVVVEGEIVQRAHITLLTDAGFRQFRLDDVRTVRFVNPDLQRELEAALAVLAANRQDDRKTVTVRFTGSGQREVRIAYVREVPVWKSSYRLVLGEPGDAQLQGWAIVENTSESDWHDVRLRLAATQPISFVMDLYSPIYRDRPRVAPPESPIVAPQEFDRGVAVAPTAQASRQRQSIGEEAEAMDDFAGSAGVARLADTVPSGFSTSPAQAIAESGSVYEIVEPVTIARRGAALIPIIQQSIPAHEVLIYDPVSLRGLVTRGIRFTNSGDAAIPAGPVTIFSRDGYVGDAQVPTTAAGEARLLSYAVETGAAVVVEREQSPTEITSVTIADGIMRSQREVRYQTTYQVSRVSAEDNADPDTLIVVHPRRGDRELVEPQSNVELTDAAYRFSVPFDETDLEVTVVERQVTGQTFALSSMSDEQLVFYASSQAIEQSVATVLREIAALRRVVADRQQRVSRLERDLSALYREQERVRGNLDVLSREDDVYRTFLERLSRQEEAIEQVREDLSAANEVLAQAQDELAEYIGSL